MVRNVLSARLAGVVGGDSHSLHGPIEVLEGGVEVGREAYAAAALGAQDPPRHEPGIQTRWVHAGDTEGDDACASIGVARAQ